MAQVLNLRFVGTASLLLLTACGNMVVAEAPQATPPNQKDVVLRYLKGNPPVPDRSSAAPVGGVGSLVRDGFASDMFSSGVGLGSLFRDPQKLGSIELSAPFLVQHNVLGWMWLTCMRTHPANAPARTYSLFMRNDTIEDARLSVVVDRCDGRSYAPIEPVVVKRQSNR